MKDSELVKSCQNANATAQEALYKRFADLLFRVACRYVKSEPDAEDIVIIAFGKVFQQIGSFHDQGAGSLEAWLRKIVVNESLMWLRKRHNFNLMESIDDVNTEPDLQQLAALEADDILKIITNLPIGYRTVFCLHVVEGYKHDEIASLLGISEGTSRSQLFKAKTLLKQLLTREGFHYGT